MRQRTLNIIGFILAPIICILVIHLSLSQRAEALSGVRINDKIAHFIAYIGVGGSLFLCFIREDKINFKGLCATWLTALILGGAVEIAQPYFSRSREMLDFVMDLAGSLIGIILAQIVGNWLITLKKQKK